MAAMGRSGTKRLILKKEGFELEIEREENGGAYRGTEGGLELTEEGLQLTEANRRATIALSKAKESASSLSGVTVTPALEEKGEVPPSIYVTSPMVGTFYASPSPEDPPFVKVGDKIEKNTVVCIIEAMKVMNE